MSAVELSTHSGDEAQERAAAASLRLADDAKTAEERFVSEEILLLREIRDILLERK